MKKWRRGVSFATAAMMAFSMFPVMEHAETVKAEVIADKIVTLNPSDHSTFHDTDGDGFGEFEGFGTSLCWWANQVGGDEELAKDAAKAFFSDEGLDMNIGRYNIGGGDNTTDPEGPFYHEKHIVRSDSTVPGYCTDVTKIEITPEHDLTWYQEHFERVDEECGYAWNYDWEADKNQMNVLLKAAAASGEDFHAEAFSNSPPYFMTNSGCSSGAVDSGKDNLRADSYHAFATYMADVVAHFENETGDKKVDFKSVTPLNEPYTNYWGAYSNKQEGCHFDTGASQSKIIYELSEAMKENGVTDITFSASDETSIDTAIDSFKALKYLAKNVVTRIDTHTYSGSKRTELRKLAEEYNRNLWMSEVDGAYTAGTNAKEMTAALGLSERMMLDIGELRSSAWIMWNAMDSYIDSQDKVNWPDSNNDYESMEKLEEKVDVNSGFWGIAFADHDNDQVIRTQKYYAYGQFSKYIRPGDTIIGSTGEGALAAYNTNTGKVVVVVNNTSASNQVAKIDLKNFKTIGSTVKAIRTSGDCIHGEGEHWANVTENCGLSVDLEKRYFTAELKANSITTFVMEDGVTYDASTDESIYPQVQPTVEEIPLNASMVTGSAPWNNGTKDVPTNVVDGDYTTFFDGVSDGYVQIDLGKEYEIGALGYAPRPSYESRCKGAVFYGSKDGVNWTKIYVVPSTPAKGQITVAGCVNFVTEDYHYRYIKYAVDTNGNCNVAELKVYKLKGSAFDAVQEKIASMEEETKDGSFEPASKERFDLALSEAKKLTESSSAYELAKANYELEQAYENLVRYYHYDSFSGVKGDTIYDTNGKRIQAHGGQIQKLTVNGETKYYWIGEDKTNDYRPCAGIHMYSSKDLYNWDDEGVVLKTMTSESQFETDEYFKNLYGTLDQSEKDAIFVDLWQGDSASGCVIERPKMLYNEKTGKYVIWFHADGNDPKDLDGNSNYAKAKAGIAIADSPTGPYRLLGSYLLDGAEDANRGFDGDEAGHVRDMNLFKDDDGSAYVIYSSDGNQTMYIAKLNDSYTGLATPRENAVEGVDYVRNFIGESREAPAMFKHNGKYFLITSGCTGWSPNPARYAVSDSPMGPFTMVGDPCTDTESADTDAGSATTYDTQSTCVFEVEPGKFIYMGDRWRNPDVGGSLRDSRYVWLPVEFLSDSTIALRRYSDWKLEVLDGLEAYQILTELPSVGSSLKEIAEQLPETIKVKYSSGTEKEENITWNVSAEETDKLGEVTIAGTMDNGRQVSFKATIVHPNTIYFMDCAAKDLDITSSYVTEVRRILGDKIRNKDDDQVYTVENHAGLYGDKSSMVGTKDGGEGIFAHGYWAKSGKNIDYKFDLEAGEYETVLGFCEWWSTSRGMKITVSVDEEILAEESFTLASSDTSLQKKLAFSLPNNASVTISVSKTGNSDGVLSFVGIIQNTKTGDVADFTALNEVLQEAALIKNKNYSKESWERFAAAYEDAKKTASDMTIDQASIEKAAKELKAAMEQLVTAKSILTTALNKYTIKDEMIYTASSLKVYKEIRSEAEKLNKYKYPDSEKVSDTVNALKHAYQVLHIKSNNTLKKEIQVQLNKGAISSIKVSKKSMKVSWKKDIKTDGYLVEYSLRKDFKSGVKKIVVSDSKTTSTTIKNLKKGQKYYVRISGRKVLKINNKNVTFYGKTSSVKQSAKIK